VLVNAASFIAFRRGAEHAPPLSAHLSLSPEIETGALGRPHSWRPAAGLGAGFPCCCARACGRHAGRGNASWHALPSTRSSPRQRSAALRTAALRPRPVGRKDRAGLLGPSIISPWRNRLRCPRQPN